jgi:uncharacterized protein
MAKRGNPNWTKGVSGNPSGKRKQQIVRADSYLNTITGHGTSRDHRTATQFYSNVLTDQQAIALRRGNWLAARIVEQPASEAFRRGFDLRLDDKETSELVQSEIETLQLARKFVQAIQMAATVGGAALYPVLDGAQDDLATPLIETSITKVRAIHVLERRELEPMSWYEDIAHPKFGQPETYRLWPLSSGRRSGYSTQLIHESRLAIFPGRRFTREALTGQRWGWGDSELSLVDEVLADFGLAWQSAASLLQKAGRRIYRLSGLADLLQDERNEPLVARRMTALDTATSPFRLGVIDKEDEYVQEAAAVDGGISTLLDQFKQLIAAAARRPVTILFGTSPAGLNATGESDIRAWYDTVSELQADVTDRLEWMVRLILLSTEGPLGGKEPETWSIEWRPLWSPSEKEIAETRSLVAQTDKTYFDMGVASAKDIAESRFSGDTFSMETTIDFTELEKRIKADETEKQQRAEIVNPMNLLAPRLRGPMPPDDDDADEEGTP